MSARGALGRLWRAWVALWDRREPPTALAIIRITTASVLLVDMLRVGALGLVDPLWSPPPDGFALPYHGWADALGLGAHGLWLLDVIALSCVVLGAGTRVALVVACLASAQLSHLAPEGESGMDALFRIVFVILALSQCNAKWSIDALIARKRGRTPPAEVPAWPRYLIMAQLVWMYFSGGQNKSSAEWGPHGGFTALANAMTDPQAGRLAPSLVDTLYPLTQVATAFTILFELTAPLYLVAYYFAEHRDRGGRIASFLATRWRWFWLALGVSFQIGIAITLRLGSFPYGMLALYPALLLPRELQRRNTPAPANLASSPS